MKSYPNIPLSFVLRSLRNNSNPLIDWACRDLEDRFAEELRWRFKLKELRRRLAQIPPEDKILSEIRTRKEWVSP